MKTWNAIAGAALGLTLGVGAPSAHASYLTVNGTCVASIAPDCTPDLQTAPGANQLNIDQTITLANGDQYLITGTVFVTTFFPATPVPPFGPPQEFTLNPEFQVQYIGKTPSQADTLSLLFSQDFENIAISSGSFTNFLTGFTAGMFGAGSSIQMVNTVGTTSFPTLISPLTSSFDVEQTESISTLANPLTDSIAYTMFVGSGSEPGFIVEVPAPAAIAVLGIGLLGLGAVRRRIR